MLLFAISGTATGKLLDDYLVIAAENNPSLKAKYLQYQAALERVPQVGSLPDPQLGFSYFIMPMERYIGDQTGSISLMQMFPWFGTLEAARDEMTCMAKARFEEFNEAKSMLFYEVRANWYALQLLEKEIAITSENIELLKTMEQVAITKFKSGGQSSSNSGSSDRMGGAGNQNINIPGTGMGGMGMRGQTSTGSSSSGNMPQADGMKNMVVSGSMIDVLRVQMEINELKNSLSLLGDSKIPIIARFNQLLNRYKEEPVILPDTILASSLPAPLNEIPDSIRDNNPMLKMLEQEEAAYIAQGKMNQKMGLPMIGVGLQYDIFKPRANSESMDNGKDMLMPMFTVTIPVWRKKYRASVNESAFMRQSVIEQRQDVSNQLIVNYEDVLKDYKDAERRSKLYQDQTLLADQVLNILMVQYTTEGSSFEDVLRMQQQLLDYRLKYLDALIDGNIAVAMIQRLMGR
ncbi:MAG: TolC family protein [Desulfatiglans sp.]|nr:TolC family protein [Desulfatiglans sp.]